MRIALSGDWTVQSLSYALGPFRSQVLQSTHDVIICLEGITRLDTAGALAVNEAALALRERGQQVSIKNSNPRYARLLETSQPARPEPQGLPPLPFPLNYLCTLGKMTADLLSLCADLAGFLGRFLTTLVHLLFRPSQIRWTSLVFFMDQGGLRAVPIVSMLTFLIGLVVAYMGMQELGKFGVKMLAIKLVEVSIFRELGVIIASIVVAGRSSSSFTAQIGAMVSNQEVAALQSMGLDPMRLLVVPRIVALVLTMPMLVLFANVAGLLGGAVAICLAMDMSLSAYFVQVYNGALLWNFLVGIIKSPFCALAVGVVGCYQGFRAKGSAESVGFLTTISVVQSIFLVIVIDAFFTLFFTVLGL